MIDIEVKDAGGWIESWQNWTPEQSAQEPIREGMRRAARRLAKYPPTRRGQRYKRTGGLGREWMGARIVVQGMDARMSNQKRYARYVQGEGSQAWMHKKRWMTDKEAVDAEMPQIVAEIDAAIAKDLNG